MKKQIMMLLCTAVLTLGLTAAPAMASAGPYSPIEVETYTYGPLDELRINKAYQLPAAGDPSGISTEDFERGGRRYYLLDMISANTDHETVTYNVRKHLVNGEVFPTLFLGKEKGRSVTGTPSNSKADIRFWCKYCCSIARKPLVLLAFGVNPISPLAP